MDALSFLCLPKFAHGEVVSFGCKTERMENSFKLTLNDQFQKDLLCGLIKASGFGCYVNDHTITCEFPYDEVVKHASHFLNLYGQHPSLLVKLRLISKWPCFSKARPNSKVVNGFIIHGFSDFDNDTKNLRIGDPGDINKFAESECVFNHYLPPAFILYGSECFKRMSGDCDGYIYEGLLTNRSLVYYPRSFGRINDFFSSLANWLNIDSKFMKSMFYKK